MSRLSPRTAGVVLLGLAAMIAALAPWLSPHDPAAQFADYSYAPPMVPRVVDDQGRWRRPFVYPLRLVNRLERRYTEDRTAPVTIRFLSGGALADADAPSAPWLPLGADALGRDVFARLVLGARASLGVALLAAALALAIGALVGAVAGFAGGLVDELLMRLTDIVLVLPVVYVVLTLRAMMPLVLTPARVFWTMVLVLALAGWAFPARAVRAVIAVERRREYAEAAYAIGAGPVRILLRHLLPAARGVMAVQATLLLPAFILAEATLSFVGFGFAEPLPSWGLMLQQAGQIGIVADAPWLLSPAAAIVYCVLAVQLAAGSTHGGPAPRA